MDPSIVKFLEDDDDENMHSGADLEAFTAALNRDIGRDGSDASQTTEAAAIPPPPPDSAAIEYAQQESREQWQISNQEGEPMQANLDKTLPNLQFQEEHLSEMGLVKHENSIQSTQVRSHIEQEEAQQEQVEKGDTNNIESKQILNSEQNHLSHEESVAKEAIGSQKQQKQPTSQLSNQQPQSSSDPATNPTRKMKLSSISFYTLIPVLRPHLDKDKYMQLNNAFTKLKNNEISRDYFLRVIRNTVGDQMLRKTVHQVMQAQALTARNSQLSQNQHQLQGQSSSQQVPVRNARHLENQSISQVRTAALSSAQHQRTLIGQPETGAPTGTENSGQGIAGTQITSTKKERVNLLQTSSKQQNLSQLPPGVPMQHGATPGSFVTHQFQRPNAGGLGTLNSKAQDSQLRQIPFPPRMLSSQSGATQPINLTNMSKKPSSNKEQGVGNSSSMIYIKQEVPEQLVESHSGPQFPVPSGSSVRMSDQVNSSLSKDIKIEKQPSRISLFTSTSMMSTPHVTGPNVFTPDQAIQIPGLSGSSAKTPLKKPSVGQKKPFETQSTPPLPSKKQKLSGAYQDLSIEQLNDVTAVSGVDLREEEEQLLNAPKEDNRASEAIRRVVQEEEEERLIVQRSVLQKKTAEILSKCGLKNVSTDFERCISVVRSSYRYRILFPFLFFMLFFFFFSFLKCVEDRLRGFISNLIRISKQRVDSEKPRHRIVFTSDVRREVLAMNRKAKEELDKKHTEGAEKLRKQNEGDGNVGDDTEKDRDESRSKLPKAANKDKDEDDKMRATAANVAARAAVGGDDMLSKWQLMAEQARQKREGGGGGSDMASTPSEPGKTVVAKQTTTSGSSSSMDVLHPGKNLGNGSSSSAGVFGRNPAAATSMMAHLKVNRSILAKDVVAVLEREPQMSRSILLYRLLNRI